MARKIRIECQTRFMKWLLGTYTSRFNRRHRLFGHLFSGRYKALVVDGRGNVLAHGVRCVHLNPVRAKLLRAEQPLRSYRWSSYGSICSRQVVRKKGGADRGRRVG